MKMIFGLLLFTCALGSTKAQVNFVKNPSFEDYFKCPVDIGTIYYSKYWRNPVDSTFFTGSGSDYFNTCADPTVNVDATIPSNTSAFQYPHSGNAMVGSRMFYDKTSPPPPSYLPFNTREYTQGHLVKQLQNGKTYCVTFWVNLAEASGYAHNKIGAYLDDGSINTAVDSVGKEITSVVPQVYTDSIIKDTMNWTKIEGSFVANGTETYITIGLFYTNVATSTLVTNYWFSFQQESYYLIDDVSVIPIDLDADAGTDKWVEETKTVQIGRVGDTTAMGLDCKWYHKGALIDSGAIISVNANSIKYAVDTYVVVQTICGIVKSDTVLVKTVGLGMKNIEAFNKYFNIYPNPSSGTFTITSTTQMKGTIKVYDLIGKLIYEGKLNDKETSIQLNAASGVYIVELTDETNNKWRKSIIIN